MLKKYLGIFKRDKRGFSEEELKRQRTYNCWVFVILIVVDFLWFIWSIRIWDKYNFSIFILLAIISAIICKINENRINRQLKEIGEKIAEQYWENRRKEILKRIQNQEFSRLEILDEEIKQKAVQECLKTGKIRVTKEPYGVSIVIGEILVGDSYCIPEEQIQISEDDILKYFKLIKNCPK